MAEPIVPEFAEPGSYIRYFGVNILDPIDDTKMFRYVRLLEREAPLRYPFEFSSLAVDAVGSSVTFSDLEPGRRHLYQAFLGIAPGVRIRVFLPLETRILRFDQNIAQISDDQTGVLTHGLSPYEQPQYEMWIPPNKQFPALVPQNATADLLGVPGGKTILPRVIFINALFNYEIIEDPSLLDMLTKKKIPSKPISFGGSVREIPR